MKVDKEFVTWAYRILLGREPENERVIEQVVESNLSPMEYTNAILYSKEFKQLHAKETQPLTLECRVAEVDDLLLRVSLKDAFLSRRVLQKTFDRNESKFVRSVLHRGDCAIDIGANLGYYTILFVSVLGHEGHVYSFEPMPMQFDSLVKSI